jgi:hypothetical protein
MTPDHPHYAAALALADAVGKLFDKGKHERFEVVPQAHLFEVQRALAEFNAALIVASLPDAHLEAAPSREGDVIDLCNKLMDKIEEAPSLELAARHIIIRLLEQRADLLKRLKARPLEAAKQGECVCGETSARNCPEHQEAPSVNKGDR